MGDVVRLETPLRRQQRERYQKLMEEVHRLMHELDWPFLFACIGDDRLGVAVCAEPLELHAMIAVLMERSEEA